MLRRSLTLYRDFRESFYDAVMDGDSPFAGDIRRLCLNQMHAALPDQPELWAKLTPSYNPGCKRIIISDDYYPALAQANVTLETRPIARIHDHIIDLLDTTSGSTAPGSQYDLLVCATGFKTLEFMHPVEIKGLNNRPLSDIWAGGARAFNGVNVEDLPNFGRSDGITIC